MMAALSKKTGDLQCPRYGRGAGAIGRMRRVLSTATPSLETYVNARDGRYQAHRLTARHGAAQLPEIELVDMRADQPPRGAWLVPQMVARVGAAIERGEQALFVFEPSRLRPAYPMPRLRPPLCLSRLRRMDG